MGSDAGRQSLIALARPVIIRQYCSPAVVFIGINHAAIPHV